MDERDNTRILGERLMKKYLYAIILMILGLSNISLAGNFDKLNAFHLHLERRFDLDLSISVGYEYFDDQSSIENRFKDPLLSDLLSGSVDSYIPSELSEWNADFVFGGGFTRADDKDIGGLHYESDITTMHFGVNARKDRMLVRTILHREDFVGKNAFQGVDSENVGVLFMPGYRVWSQQENGLNVDVYGQLDVSFLNNEQSDNAWYVVPGVRAEISHASRIGIFRGAYSFNHARNIDGDRELTNKGHINEQGWLFDYLTLITEAVYAHTGINHAMINDTPNGVDRDYTAYVVGLGMRRSSRLNLRGNYFEAIDGRNDRGFTFELMCAWR